MERYPSDDHTLNNCSLDKPTTDQHRRRVRSTNALRDESCIKYSTTISTFLLCSSSELLARARRHEVGDEWIVCVLVQQFVQPGLQARLSALSRALARACRPSDLSWREADLLDTSAPGLDKRGAQREELGETLVSWRLL